MGILNFCVHFRLQMYAKKMIYTQMKMEYIYIARIINNLLS